MIIFDEGILNIQLKLSIIKGFTGWEGGTFNN